MGISNLEKKRYTKGTVGATNTNVASLVNPTAIMWWSAAIPGYGHVMLCKYVTGFLLIAWEFLVNVNSKLNTAILYTFLGRFDEAIDVINLNWILLYAPVYLFSMWDSRRVAIDLNKYAILADMSNSASEIDPITISSVENNYLDRRKPWLSIFWSLITPGLGHLYVNRLPSGFFIFIWFLIVTYFSRILPAMHYTFTGDVAAAIDVIDPQWIIFLPSMYCFAPYAAFVECNSYNKLMNKQQSSYLMAFYQDSTFKTKCNLFSKRDDLMNIVASFKHTVYLELAIKELERNGITRQNIFAIPLTEKKKIKKKVDLVRGGGFSLLDGSFAFGTVCSLFGVIYGFVLPGGPVTWGLIGLALGFSVGFLF
ncbi:MAG: hypothetical protein LRY71_01420 [Bacillaceae bacterium]|nr:hypothetical protein [Bacillaceae bacterium]